MEEGLPLVLSLINHRTDLKSKCSPNDLFMGKDKNETSLIHNNINVKLPIVDEGMLLCPKDPKLVLENALKFRK